MILPLTAQEASSADELSFLNPNGVGGPGVSPSSIGLIYGLDGGGSWGLGNGPGVCALGPEFYGLDKDSPVPGAGGTIIGNFPSPSATGNDPSKTASGSYTNPNGTLWKWTDTGESKGSIS